MGSLLPAENTGQDCANIARKNIEDAALANKVNLVVGNNTQTCQNESYCTSYNSHHICSG